MDLSVVTLLCTSSLLRASGVVAGKTLGSQLGASPGEASSKVTETILVLCVVSEKLVLGLTLCTNAEVVADTFLCVDSCSVSRTTLAVVAVTASAAEFGVEIDSCSVLATVHVKMDVVMV